MYNALIRTHHITSRKKVAALRTAAKKYDVYALIRYEGAPGVMYVESPTESQTKAWVDVVHGLRYKDYQLVVHVDKVQGDVMFDEDRLGSLIEVESVKEFAAEMEKKGLLGWWRKGMGFVTD
ncbi:hypothetical protein LTR66_015367 [Elasticomyces elasticus]|nr:hypothetical protein LTR66_015367 [Elasticomyces elasticus]